MRWVDRPHLRPHHCAVLPYVGQTNGCRFIDTGTELSGGFDDRIYVSEPAAIDIARMVGFISPGELRQVETQLAAEREARLEAEGQLARARSEVDAVHVLTRAGYRQQAKPGRKPKEEAIA